MCDYFLTFLTGPDDGSLKEFDISTQRGVISAQTWAIPDIWHISATQKGHQQCGAIFHDLVWPKSVFP